MISRVETVRWVYACQHCKKEYRFDSELEAQKFEAWHDEHCPHNIEAKRCATCGYCYLPSQYSEPICDIGQDVRSTEKCLRYNISNRPHSERKIPVLKMDYPIDALGIILKKGTVMEYFYGYYCVHNVGAVIKDNNIGAYYNDAANLMIKEEYIVWISADSLQKIQQAKKDT